MSAVTAANINTNMTKKTRNWLIVLSILAFPFVLFCAFLFFMQEPLPPLAPLPNPNGYEDLVKAGQTIRGDYWDFAQTNLEKLRVSVSTNAEALALARDTLSSQCGVPIELTTAFSTNHIKDLVAFRSLAQAMVCEGKLAEKENRFDDAANSYLDTVRLGSQITHGGLLVDEMVDVAIRSLGETQFQGMVTNLDAPACRKAAAALETCAADRQTLAATLQQHEAWSRRTYGWRWGWRKLIYFSARQKNLQHAMGTFNGNEQREGRLLIDLAARAYELDKGHPPASAADFVPEYLKAIPQDPVTGTNLVYAP